MTSVDVAFPRKVSRVLIDYLEETQGPQIELEHDYFWSVPHDSAYDVTKAPDELTVGQLTECIENLKSSIDGDHVLSYDLVWLGDVLGAVGAQVVV